MSNEELLKRRRELEAKLATVITQELSRDRYAGLLSGPAKEEQWQEEKVGLG